MDNIIKQLVDRCREKLDYYDIVDECSEMVDYGSIIEFLFGQIANCEPLKEFERFKWISVKDRLPSKKKVIDGETYFKNVAVRVKDLEFEKIAFYDDEEKCWFDTEFFPIAGEVTHWCDLPQPPKGE